MAVLLSVADISRSVGARPLFEGLSLDIQEDERVGLVGPNGSGKSTVLRILAGRDQPDHGERVQVRDLRLAYVPQDETFDPAQNPVEILAKTLLDLGYDQHEAEMEAERRLRVAGFAAPSAAIGSLSGGWKKRLAIIAALTTEPQLMLLDEPTNHLDLEGVLWLEKTLTESPASIVVVSHDRAFLDAVALRVVEINPRFPDGHYSSVGGYADFIENRATAIAGLEKQQHTLANTVAKDTAWLKRNPKAQMKKGASRVAAVEANAERLSEMSWRSRQGGAVRFDVAATGRGTQDLMVATGLSVGIGGKVLVNSLDLHLGPGVRVGLLGRNGSGKSTLLRVLSGELQPLAGKLKRAVDLRAVYFRQDRSSLDHKATLRYALCPNSDTVDVRGAKLHVVAWARRLGFRQEQLEEPVGMLSGGEQARLLISQLVQRPADLLLLDEPTNDLDVATLEVLEEAIGTFPGAVVLVSHDRFLLNRVSTVLVALDGRGGATRWADYWQWQKAQVKLLEEEANAAQGIPSPSAKAKPVTAGLTKSERREWERLDEKIAEAEAVVKTFDVKMASPRYASDALALERLHDERTAAQQEVDRLFARWQFLDEKSKTAPG